MLALPMRHIDKGWKPRLIRSFFHSCRKIKGKARALEYGGDSLKQVLRQLVRRKRVVQR